jgi:hypothetical protein
MYWSSTQDSDQKPAAWADYFDRPNATMIADTPGKGKTHGVRPVRAF